MNNALLNLYVKMQSLMARDEGQDLVEYALVLALISVVAVASLNGVATQVKLIFTTIKTDM